ncbi:MAG: aminotransferase class V-fold PLP-dependent enzyme [Deltaproteobacteria bacterium]|nr:aminotransferase class V-fold PLP-dependent enzyme [Deltaproteobacteria bacterium]
MAVSGAGRLGDRSLFPDLAARAYLNHAGASPPSLPVLAAVRDYLAATARGGMEGHRAALQLSTRLRERAAELVGGAPADVALTPGLSSGVQAVAIEYPWRPGDRVVLFEGEFPANVTPWQQAAALHGLQPTMLPLAEWEDGSGLGLARLEETLRRGARLVAVSAVQFRTGYSMPLAEMAALCDRHGAELFVDAIQACGAVPIDAPALGIDYLATGAHKWLMGIHGAGFLWVKPGRAEALRPWLAGWLAHEDPVGFLTRGPGHLRYDRPIRREAAALEGSSSSTSSQAALLASLELLLGLGVPAIRAHLGGWLDGAAAALAARGFEVLRSPDPARRSGFFSARPPPGVAATRLRDGLAARGVAVAIPDGLLRIAPHWPNAPAEVPVLAAALDEVLAERP